MARKEIQLGPTGRFERRYGFQGVPDAGGVNSRVGDADPTAVPPHQFLQFINGRWPGKVPRPRGGQRKVNAAAMQSSSSARVFPYNFTQGAAFRVWMMGVGCPEVSAATGLYVGMFDFEQCPRLQRVVYYADASAPPSAIGSYGGVPYVTVDTQLRRLQLGKIPWGVEMIDYSGASQDIPIANLPTGYRCYSMREFDGKLFLACGDGGGNGKVMSWNGLSLKTDLTGVGEVVALGLYRDSLVAGFLAAENKIRLRAAGDTPSWTSVAPGVGNVQTYPGNNSIAPFQNDKVYGAGGDDGNIWEYDGTTLTVGIHAAGTSVTALLDEGNPSDPRLFFGYTDTDAKLGYFDGTLWNDGVKNLASDVTGATQVEGLTRHRQHIVAALAPAGIPASLAIAQRTAISDPYEVVAFNGTYAGSIFYLEGI